MLLKDLGREGVSWCFNNTFEMGMEGGQGGIVLDISVCYAVYANKTTIKTLNSRLNRVK